MNANDPADDKTFDHDQDGIPTFLEDNGSGADGKDGQYDPAKGETTG